MYLRLPLTDFRRAVEAADEVGGDVVLGDVRRRAEVAQLEQQLGLVDEHVVGLDVGVQDRGPPQELEGEEQLLGVRAHGLDVQPDVLPVLLEHLAQVHAATVAVRLTTHSTHFYK